MSKFPSFRFIGSYGNLKTYLRQFSWDLFRCLHSSSNLPWLLAGDFIEILYVNRKTSRERNNWQVGNFRNANLDAGLFDLGYGDLKFTWKDPKHKANYIKTYLDRGLAAVHSSQVFSTHTVQNTLVSHSNNLALVFV